MKLNVLLFGYLGDAVVNVYINHEKKFAFVEMRSVEEASNAMALDGIIFEVSPVFLPMLSSLLEWAVSWYTHFPPYLTWCSS